MAESLKGALEGASPPKKPAKKPRWRRAAVATAVALLSLPLVYLVGMNVFLSTPLFEAAIDREPETVDIHYERGWSWIPGRIHARKLVIRGRDSNVEWILRLDRVEFDVSLAALAKMRFEVGRARGSGISFRARQRLDQPPRSPSEVKDLPPIEGLPQGYAVRPPKGDEREVWSDADWHLWTVKLEDVIADDVREIWIDNQHFEGSARITGGFYLKPIRSAWVGPIHMDVGRGAIRRGMGPVLVDGLAGPLDMTLDRFDPRVVRGKDMLRLVSVATDLRLRAPDLDALALTLPDGMHAFGTVEVPKLAIKLEHGALVDGSQVRVESAALSGTYTEHRLTTRLAAKADIVRSARAAGLEPQNRLMFEVTASDLGVVRQPSGGNESAVLRVASVTAVGDAAKLDLLDAPLSDLHGTVDVHDTQLPDAKLLDRYVPKSTPFEIRGGSAAAEVHLEAWLADHRTAGSASLRAEDLDFRLAKLRIKGSTNVRGSFADYQWNGGVLSDAALSVVVSKASMASMAAPNVPKIQVAALNVHGRASVVDLDDPLKALDVNLDVERAAVVDREFLSAYLPSDDGGDEGGLVGTPSFSLRGHVTIANHVARGNVDVHSERLSFAHRGVLIDAGLAAKARVHDWRWERGDLAIDEANVLLSKLHFSRRGTPNDVPITIDAIRVAAKSPHFSFSDPLENVHVGARIERVFVRDSAIANELLPEGVPFAVNAESSTLESSLDADVVDHVAKGRFTLAGRRLGLVARGLRVRGDVAIDANLEDWKLEEDTMKVLASRVALSDVSGRITDGAAQDFTAKHIELRVSTPELDLDDPTLAVDGADARLIIDQAALPDARSLNALLPGSVFKIESGTAKVAADIQLNAGKSIGRGFLNVALSRAGFTIHETKLVGDINVAAKLDGYNRARHELDVSGTVVNIRNLDVTGASTEAHQWFGDLFVKRGFLRMAPERSLEADARLESRDASPVLAILLRNDLPKLFVGLTKMPHLGADAHVTVKSDAVVLKDVDLRGGDIVLRGLYATHGDHHRGAFVVGRGLFSAGLRFDDGGVGIRFFGLDGWLHDQSSAVAQLLAQPIAPTAKPVTSVPREKGRVGALEK